MDTNTVVVALTTTQTTIIVVAVLVLLAIALWILFLWRPRHRTRQAETAAQMFREDHLGDWARKRLSTWTTDERHAALRYYTRVGFQARSGAIHTDMVPDNHHATIVALAAQETDGGSSQTKWGEVEWLGRNLAKRRDDLSIKWTPTAKAAPESNAKDSVPVEVDDEPPPDLAGDSDQQQTSGDGQVGSDDETDKAGANQPSGESEPSTQAPAVAQTDSAAESVGTPIASLSQSPDDTTSDSLEHDYPTDSEDPVADEDSAANLEGSTGIETSEDFDATTAQATSLADALARAELAPDIATSSTSLDVAMTVAPDDDETTDTSDSESQDPEVSDPEIEAAISESIPTEDPADQTSDHDQTTDRANVPTWILDARAALDSLDADVTSSVAETGTQSSPSSKANEYEESDNDFTNELPIEAEQSDETEPDAASADQDGTEAQDAEPSSDDPAPRTDVAVEEAVELVGLASNDEAPTSDEHDDLKADDISLADLDDVEVAYLAASTAKDATEADAELRIRMQRLRRRAKRQMRKSADDRAVAVRRAEQGRKKKAREYTTRATAHETKAKKFKARRRKLRDIRSGTYIGP